VNMITAALGFIAAEVVRAVTSASHPTPQAACAT
jgi:hypothetical protein